jgi:hypothetical protein
MLRRVKILRRTSPPWLACSRPSLYWIYRDSPQDYGSAVRKARPGPSTMARIGKDLCDKLN